MLGRPVPLSSIRTALVAVLFGVGAATCGLLLVVGCATLLSACSPAGGDEPGPGGAAHAADFGARVALTAPTPPAAPPAPSLAELPSDARRLQIAATIRGDITPKSVVASDTGLVFAQNMMYRHSVTVYDRSFTRVGTVDDAVTLPDFGLGGPDEPVRGAPVEAAFSPDGAHAYVSNYSLYGPGFDHEGTDSCTPDIRVDESAVYRIDVASLEIDQVIPVGRTPKHVAVTPDGRLVLVTNWCSWDLSVIDTGSGRELERIPMGRYPRGIAIDGAGATAYVAIMGGTEIAAVDLADFTVERIRDVGRGPRHLVLGPDDRYLYATLNKDGLVARVDLQGPGHAVTAVATGAAPRSMDIAPDGRSLYVVNYGGNSIAKLRTEDMTVVQEIPFGDHPIGITYDDGTDEIWVAGYRGSIRVYADR